MTSKGNTVNINTPKGAYHHGDLRSALIETGLKRLEQGSAESLSLRDIAREIGVSATAIYRHFPDKDSLLAALAAEGLAKLAREQKAAGMAGGKQGFAEMGRAYVRFAMRHPALFRLIYSSLPPTTDPACQNPEESPGWLLRQTVSDLAGPTASDAQRRTGVLRAWALVHGLAMLMLSGQIAAKDADKLIDEVISVDSLKLG
ncbi:TetR/AcrR family transcriptional regulator [Hyphomonas johnsonii]|uniref:TetR family transcriptional regulator n=1 Tax=Hyphomonas johnsonii MHS-2 TaxID=1280950 RepID=A0A059FTL6_9PROT|nr:TetR/AcrR family transcriptional regulator [Hyphomonas johnsonii]KCZ93808.1 TetR family transcriptional regulator [Hyphomonas johnsonii MHS-2]